MDHNKLENHNKLEEMENTRPPDLPPEKSEVQEPIVKNGHGTTDWFQIGKEICQGCIL